MPSRRYTILIADRTSGVVRRVTISAGPAVAVACAIVTLPVLVGIGAAWKAKSDVSALYADNRSLEAENANYRGATEALSEQIASLQSVVADIGASSNIDPETVKAVEKLPAFVKNKAIGGAQSAQFAQQAAKTFSALTAAEDTFGLLRNVLEGVQNRLSDVRNMAVRRNALADATPSIWPVQGWLTSRMGARQDPMTGGEDFHPGLDIAGEKGQLIFATAAGTVTQADYQGGYGNLVVIKHEFGLETKYGHLSSFSVKPGQTVKRGDPIGRLGATGRATGNHLHYEVRANGRLLNPLQLLTQQKPRAQ